MALFCSLCIIPAAVAEMPKTTDEFVMPKIIKNIDVYQMGRFDFNDDNRKEQIVIDSGGGSGGPIWHIRRLNGIKISEDLFGSLSIAEKRNGYYQLVVISSCGWNIKNYYFYRYVSDKYICYRHEIHDLTKKTIVVKKIQNQKKAENRLKIKTSGKFFFKK